MSCAANTSSATAHRLHLRLLLRTTVIAALLLLTAQAAAAETTAARAEDEASELPAISDEEAPPAPASTERAWYGWQIMLSDLASVGAFTAGAVSWNSPAGSGAMLAAGLGYPFGGPAVHLAHGRPGAAGWSLLRRFVLPLGGAFAGALIAGKDRGSDEEIPASAAGAALGMLSGMGIAMAYDWVAAREDVSRPPPAAWEDASDADASRWAPLVAVGRDRAAFGLAMHF
jgi:hypothetical protein